MVTTPAGVPSSASVSLPLTAITTVSPSSTVAVSSFATGASLTGLTVMLTVAVLDTTPLLSVTV